VSPAPQPLVATEAAVAKHISSILAKLDLPPTEEDHRRVMAVLAFLRGWADGCGPPPRNLATLPGGPGRHSRHDGGGQTSRDGRATPRQEHPQIWP
jgi:hypothetical protein